MPTTSPAITIPQNSSMKSIMTIPPAPQTHHIGCIPQPQSGTRSWASAAPGARAAPDPTSHHLARRNIVGPPLLTSHHEDATIAYGALDRRVWQHRRLHRTCATPVVKPTKYPARGVLHDFVPQTSKRLDRERPQVDRSVEQFTVCPGHAGEPHPGSRFRPSGHGPHTALAPRWLIASAHAEGRAPLNGRAHLGAIRPSPLSCCHPTSSRTSFPDLGHSATSVSRPGLQPPHSLE